MKPETIIARVVVEKASDGGFACYTDEIFDNFMLAGYGDTSEEAIKDMLASYEETKEYNAERGVETPKLKFEYRYDMQSFFNYFSFLNVTKVAEKAKMNPSLLRQYASGKTKASAKQYSRVKTVVNKMAEEILAAQF